jgi:hypothetical protein
VFVFEQNVNSGINQKYYIMPVMKLKHDLIKNLFLLLITSLVYMGCSKTPKEILSNLQFNKGVEHTTVKPIINNNETIAIINVTFLNNSHVDTYDNEYNNFLIGFYLANNEKVSLDDKKTHLLKLNGKFFDKYEFIDKSNHFFKKIPIQNPYAQYFIVSFKKVDDLSKLKLAYKYSSVNKVTLDFVIK